VRAEGGGCSWRKVRAGLKLLVVKVMPSMLPDDLLASGLWCPVER
jgi:hypothetical protein